MLKQLFKKSIGNQVETLIQRFNFIHEEYIRDSSDILNKIIDLRKEENPFYNVNNLVREKGLEEHDERIRKLFKFKDMSEKTQELYAEGKLKSSTVMLMMSLPRQLTREENQNKIADLVTKGKITNEDLTKEEHLLKVMKMVIKDPLPEYDLIVSQIMNEIETLKRRIKSYHELFEKEENKRLLIFKIKELNDSIKVLFKKEVNKK